MSCLEKAVTVQSNTQEWASNRRGVGTERTVVWINTARTLGMIISSEWVRISNCYKENFLNT